MEKKQISLMKRFQSLFLVFILAALVLSGTLSYVNMNRFYHSKVEEQLTNVTDYLNRVINADGREFVRLREYFQEHKEEMYIPVDFDGDFRPARAEFEKLWSQHYPGTALEEMNVEDMDEDVRSAYMLYLYEYFLYYMEQARSSFQVEYTYLVYPVDEEKLTMCYFLDAVRGSTESDPKRLLLGDEVVQSMDLHKYMWEAWTTGEKPSGLDKINNEYGNVYSCSMPVIVDGETVGVVVAEVTVEKVNGTIRSMTLMQCFVVFLVLALCSGLMLKGIQSSILRRITQLKGHMENYFENKEVSLARVMEQERASLKSTDEIDVLSDRFSGLIRELDEYMHNLEKVTAERERIGAELNVATDIQASMLPCIFPPFPERDEFDLFGSMDPAKEVGGDFYDFFMVDEQHLGLVIADVSGKGVPAALFMVIAKTLIKNHAQTGASVEDVLIRSNNQLCEGNGGELFVTAWYGCLDLNTGILDFAEAGHENPLLLHEDGSVEQLRPRRKRPPLAAMEGMRYLSNQVQLKPGDTLFLYTDGVPEATDANNELYGMERLEAFVPGHVKDTPDELLTAIRADVDAFVGDAPQFDDLTMLAMKLLRINTEAKEA